MKLSKKGFKLGFVFVATYLIIFSIFASLSFFSSGRLLDFNNDLLNEVSIINNILGVLYLLVPASLAALVNNLFLSNSLDGNMINIDNTFITVGYIVTLIVLFLVGYITSFIWNKK